jgi:alkylation response protein AidB-like acyl-CoA dehydrogenase
MEFGFSDLQEMLRKTARDFLQKECPKSLVRESEQNDEGYSLDLWRKMAELGWMGLIFPEEYGGVGRSFLDLVLLLEEMGRALVPGPFIPTVCSGLAILRYGSEEQKRQLLPKLVEGGLILTSAFTRPIPPAVAMKDEIGREDGMYVLSGTRLFVPYAHVADWLLYLAENKRRRTLLLVDRKSRGISLTPLETIALDKQWEIVVDKVSVPPANILGRSGEEIVTKLEEWGALAWAAFVLGGLEQVLEMSVEHAKQRIQFERPIGSFQIIQHQCADMVMDIDGVKFLCYEAAWKLSKGLPANKEISMAKARASDASRRVCLLGIKIHGGVGITVEHDIQLYFRRAKAAELAFGDADLHREVIAKEMGL